MTRTEYELTADFVSLIIKGLDLLLSGTTFHKEWDKSKSDFRRKFEKFGKWEVPEK